MPYKPEPKSTKDVSLPPEIVELTELLAKNTHETWAAKRIREGWTYGPQRNDEKKEHPDLVPYEELSDEEKEYDRMTAVETLKLITLLGYKISK
jgi:hypothetical protein